MYKIKTKPISQAIDILEKNILTTTRVYEWANLLGYVNVKRFSRKFLRYHEVTPQKTLDYHRLKSIVHYLRNKEGLSNFKIARIHNMPDEKALYNFTNYHLNTSPTQIKAMSNNKLSVIMENLGSEFQ